MNIIFESIFGSHLFGTAQPTSDHDYKGVYIPDADDILLGRVHDVKNLDTNKQGKNSSEDVDREYYSLSKFMSMLERGDMNATEMLFAKNTIERNPYWNEIIVSSRDRLISRKCLGFVGYVKKQANKYSVRGDRLNEVKQVVEFFNDTVNKRGYPDSMIISKIPGMIDALRILSRNKQFTTLVDIPVNEHKLITHFECCNRKVAVSNTLGTARKLYQSVLDEYGQRAIAAANMNGADWKALYHAVRVSLEAKQLLTEGEITFPNLRADYLIKIRLGEVAYDEVEAFISDSVDEIEQLSLTSHLRESPDLELMEDLVKWLHYEQIVKKYQ